LSRGYILIFSDITLFGEKKLLYCQSIDI